MSEIKKIRRFEDVAGSNSCFVCGSENPDGLRLHFEWCDNDEIRAYYIPDIKYQGYPGILHGGIAAAVLDDAMANLALQYGLIAVTASMELHFRKEVPINHRVTIKAKLDKMRGKHIMASAIIVNEYGNELVSAKAKLIALKR